MTKASREGLLSSADVAVVRWHLLSEVVELANQHLPANIKRLGSDVVLRDLDAIGLHPVTLLEKVTLRCKRWATNDQHFVPGLERPIDAIDFRYWSGLAFVEPPSLLQPGHAGRFRPTRPVQWPRECRRGKWTAWFHPDDWDNRTKENWQCSVDTDLVGVRAVDLAQVADFADWAQPWKSVPCSHEISEATMRDLVDIESRHYPRDLAALVLLYQAICDGTLVLIGQRAERLNQCGDWFTANGFRADIPEGAVITAWPEWAKPPTGRPSGSRTTAKGRGNTT